MFRVHEHVGHQLPGIKMGIHVSAGRMKNKVLVHENAYTLKGRKPIKQEQKTINDDEVLYYRRGKTRTSRGSKSHRYKNTDSIASAQRTLAFLKGFIDAVKTAHPNLPW